MMKNKNSMVHDSAAVPDSHTLQHPRPCDPQAGTQDEAEQSARGAEVGSWLPALDPVDFPSLQSPRDTCAYFLDASGPDFDTVLHAPHAQE